MTSDPLQNLFSDIQKILEFVEIKDKKAANAAETETSKRQAELWMLALSQQDSYTTYRQWWTIPMFQEIQPNLSVVTIRTYMEKPYTIPIEYHDALLERGRNAFLDSYVESNDYYRMLNGLPPMNAKEEDYILLSEPIRNQLHIDKSGIPIHELPDLIQNNYMATEEYQSVLEANPDKPYLKYLGSYKINPQIARKAKDFEIIRYPASRSDINPNLLTTFSSLYADYREYVIVSLYNSNLEGVYEGYREFMGLLIMSFTLLQINNSAVESLHNRRLLDDSSLYLILSMYGIPDKLMLPIEVRRNLANNILKLVREKATDAVYYDLIQILGYQDVVISKLMLMKGQQFEGVNQKATGTNQPYFVQIDLQDTNPYETIRSGKAPIYSYEEITSKDPMWWDTPDVRSILNDKLYSESDTKYITVSAAIDQLSYLFEAIYFPRMILDNPVASELIQISIPEIFGTTQHSLYDLMLYIICANCMMHGMDASILTDPYPYPMKEWEKTDLAKATILDEYRDKLYAASGFNFDMDLESFLEFLNTTQYVDTDRIMSFMKNLTVRSASDLSWIYNNVMIPMREWLEDRITNAETRQEYLEYESIYRALFTYDASRNRVIENFVAPSETIRETYQISEEDWKAFQHFYPRTDAGEAVTVEVFSPSLNTTKYYYPFLSRTDPVTWYITVTAEDEYYGQIERGNLYFHDILNCEDVRLLTNPNGTRIFMDYEDGEVGWVLNQAAVDNAIQQLEALDEDMLQQAYFQIRTPILGTTKAYAAGQKLPIDLRNGIYKTLLIEKVRMDCAGLAQPPETYFELLQRRNAALYQLLTREDRFHRNRQQWMDIVMTVITTIESELSLHMKYFEQSVLGEELFFKPLIELIRRFKSTLVDFAKTGLRYQFADKIDAGGNSNMFKLFDEVAFIISFITMSNNDYDTVFGLYDAIHRVKHHIVLRDQCESLMMTSGEGFLAKKQEVTMGSIRMVDEMKFFLNGTEYDPDGQPAHWISGEPGTGRWSDEMQFLMAARTTHTMITSKPVDFEGWKEFVESYNPI